MSLTYEEMAEICNEIKPLLIHSRFVDCFATEQHRLIFIFENIKHEKIHLLISLKQHFLRFHLINPFKCTKIPSAFAEKIKIDLCHFHVSKIEMLNEDRILQISFVYQKKELFLIAKLFSKASNVYLLNDKNEILGSYKTEKSNFSLNQLPAKPISPQNTSSHVSSKILVERYDELEKCDYFSTEIKKTQTYIKKLLNNALRLKIKSLENKNECLQWEKFYQEGLLLQSQGYLYKKGLKELIVNDWMNDSQVIKIPLDPKLSLAEEIKKRFTKSKKLKTGITHAESFLKKAEESIKLYSVFLEDLQNIKNLEDLSHFNAKIGMCKICKNEKSSQKIVKKLPYKEFISEAGLKIWVGKSSKYNDELTFQYSKGADWWLHVRDYPGSHVIIKVNKKQEPDQETLKDAQQLALHFSKANQEESAEITISQCKFVKRIGKGKTGKVQVGNSKNVKIHADPNRINNLKSKKISDQNLF